MSVFEYGIEFARKLDRDDPLASFRDRFVIDDPNLLYMDGNSLGRLPKPSVELAEDTVVRQWGERLIRGWGEGWFDAPERVGAKIASLIGADEDEVIVADSTSVNLFKLVVSALKFAHSRKTIITDDLNFPSDLYVLQGVVELLGQRHEIIVSESGDGIIGPEHEIRQSLNSDTALLTLSHAVFKSGYLYDLPALTKAAHQVGALVLWDLSHSVGAVPIKLSEAGVDLAVGCTYKYLNGGPGAPAFLYVRRDLQKQLFNPISGWMGRKKMFDFGLDYKPDPGLRKFLTGTPPVVSLSLIEPGLDILLEAGIAAVREKSEKQIAYLINLFDVRLAGLGFRLNSPSLPDRRGSHVSISHPEGLRINKALIGQMKVIPDFRAPDNIRLGIAPLYTRYQDIFHVVERIQQVVEEEIYKNYSLDMPTVT
jgi:kynureninase